MAFLWGYALGNIASSGIKTYGDLLNLKQAYQQWGDVQAERQASQNAGAPATPVDQSSSDQSILSGIQGNNPVQNPEAAMQGIIGVKTASSPEQAQAAMGNAQKMQNDWSNAQQQPISTPAPQQPVTMPGAGGFGRVATAPPTGGVAPAAGMTTPSGTYAPAISNAIGGQESGNNPRAPESINGAIGQMQIEPGTFKQFAHPGEDINNPADNQAVGQRIISHYAQAYNNDPKKVAVAYFSGPGNVNNAPDAKTPWVKDLKDGNGMSTSGYVNSVMRRMGLQNKVNSFGGGEVQNAAGDNSTAPVTHDTPLTLLKAQPLPAGVSDNNAYTFARDPKTGGVTMQRTVTASQRAMAAANEAWKRGDMKNAGALTQAAMTLQTQEAQTRVNGILNNDQLSEDQKAAALGQLAGAHVFKTENGSYIVPGLGPSDANGNPAPMNYQQLASLSTWMTSPDGMHYAMDYAIKNQQARAAAQNAATNKAEAGARINLENQQAGYYGAFRNAEIGQKEAQAENQRAQAAQRAAEADLRGRWDSLQQELADLPNKYPMGTPQYTNARQSLLDQANMLKMRMANVGGGNGKEAQPMKQEVGATYRMPDGSLKILHPTLGYVAPEVAANYDKNAQLVTSNPNWQGVMLLDKNTGMVGLSPQIAAQAGLDPHALYKDPGSAWTAVIMSPQYQKAHSIFGGGSPPNIDQSGLAAQGIPQ